MEIGFVSPNHRKNAFSVTVADNASCSALKSAATDCVYAMLEVGDDVVGRGGDECLLATRAASIEWFKDGVSNEWTERLQVCCKGTTSGCTVFLALSRLMTAHMYAWHAIIVVLSHHLRYRTECVPICVPV